MIIIQTLLGGITRLTGSGLSITKWDPLFGLIPPLNDKQWEEAFNGYKQIGQFKYINSSYTLSDFKSIFFWEWLHREWARALFVVFIVGFIYFLLKGFLNKKMIKQSLILLVLGGGLEAVIGWIMVSSGLNDSHLYVDHIKLAMHFIAAMILACFTLWFALQLLVPEEKRAPDKNLSFFTSIIILLLFVQLTYGAFMAGLKAAMAAATWPAINSMWVPDGLMQHSFINDKINVHFMHRGLAYVLFALLVIWFIKAYKAAKNSNSILQKTKWWPLLLVIIQVSLGVFTVLSAPGIVPGKFGTFEILAELHQLVAMFLLMSLVVNLYIVKRAG